MNIHKTKSDNYQRFAGQRNYNDIVGRLSLGTTGVWEIYGEDPNCDMGGSHHTPLLEVVSGRLEDVIEYGVNLPKFWQWGEGGHFKKRDLTVRVIPQGYTHADGERQKKLDEIEDLQAKIERLKKEL